MNWFDNAIFYTLHAAGQKYPLFDHLMHAVVESNFTKGALIMAIFWWLWFAQGDEASVHQTRETLVAILIGAVLAITVNKSLEISLPLNVRPIVTAGFPYAPPNPILDISEHWSSFPSDHAALFAALATGLWFISWRLGLFIWLYAVILIFIPRLYHGLHYPMDIVGGAAVGIAGVTLCNLPKIKKRISKIFLTWSERHPASFYASAFVFCFLVAILFDPLKNFFHPLMAPLKMYLKSLY